MNVYLGLVFSNRLHLTYTVAARIRGSIDAATTRDLSHHIEDSEFM